MSDLLEGLRIERGRDERTVLRTGPRRLDRWRGRLGLLVGAGLALLLAVAGISHVLATRPVRVEVATATSAVAGTPAPVLTAGGYVRAARIVYVAPKVAGRIAELPVREGDEVAAGDVLAAIETRDLTLEAIEARANRDLAQASLEMLETGSRPEEIAEARARLEAAALAKEKAEREFARAKALFDEGIL